MSTDNLPFRGVKDGGVLIATRYLGSRVHQLKMELVGPDGAALISPTTGMPIQGLAADNAAFVGNPLPAGARYKLTPDTYADGDVAVLLADANGRLVVVPNGNVAHDAVDSGNPNKMGGVYRATLPTAVADGDRTELPTMPSGVLLASVSGPNATGADGLVNTGVIYPTSSSAAASATSARTGLAVVPHGFNGTTWDRIRLAGSALGQLVENGPYSSARTIADVQYKAAAGFVRSITVTPIHATPTAGLITLYDSLTETGTVKWQKWFAATDPGGTYMLDAPFSTGIYLGFDASAANWSVSITYR